MLETVKEKIPQSIHNGWKLQNFMIYFMSFMFGSPQNWDGSPGKHNLINFAKHPAWRTQMPQYFYDTGDRLSARKCPLLKASAIWK